MDVPVTRVSAETEASRCLNMDIKVNNIEKSPQKNAGYCARRPCQRKRSRTLGAFAAVSICLLFQPVVCSNSPSKSFFTMRSGAQNGNDEEFDSAESLFDFDEVAEADTDERVKVDARRPGRQRGGALVKPLDPSLVQTISQRARTVGLSETETLPIKEEPTVDEPSESRQTVGASNMKAAMILLDTSNATRIKESSNDDAKDNQTTPSHSTVNVIDNTTSMSDAAQHLNGTNTTVIVNHRPIHTRYESAGMWQSIDTIVSFGLSRRKDNLKLSRYLRGPRKVMAKYTGLHGLVSGKGRTKIQLPPSNSTMNTTQQVGRLRNRLAAIEQARANVLTKAETKRGFWRRRFVDHNEYAFVTKTRVSREEQEEIRRMKRVQEIDRLCSKAQQRLQDLVCEKDMLQRRPNPLWNYTTTPSTASLSTNVTYNASRSMIEATREFNFPGDDLVDEYLDMMFLTTRLVKMNHSDLWRNSDEASDGEDDEFLGDPAFTEQASKNNGKRRNNGNWWLRHGLGQKIGEAAETAAYKAVCSAVMSVLAKSLSSLHGLNVMTFSDIHMHMEQTPDLPTMPYSHKNSEYAAKAIQDVIHRGSKKTKRKKRSRLVASERDFVQRRAIVETLLSHCQISAPLLKVFPLAWRRALLNNILILATSVMGDFCEGLEFQILGHRLSVSFNPITEADLLRGLVVDSNRKMSHPEEFEAAVRETAAELSQELHFLDRWHERALGSGMLRDQIANLIARLVLTITDDILTGARMDLWAKHAGGCRLVAGLDYRTAPDYMGSQP